MKRSSRTDGRANGEIEPIRVLNLLPDPRVGGPQVRVAALAIAMRQFGIDTIAATPPGPAIAYFESQGVACIQFSFSRLRIARPFTSAVRLAFSLLPTARRLSRLMRVERIDVLHCNGLMTIVGPLAARMAGVKAVWHMNDTLLPRPVYRAWLTTGRGMADEIVFSSGAVAEYAGYGADAHIMYPPLDVARFSKPVDPERSAALFSKLSLDPSCPTVVCVGHVNAVKGHQVALGSIDALNSKGVPVQLIVVGEAVDAELAARLAAFTEQRGLSKLVRFIGRSDDVKAYLDLATVFALPSLSEAMPIALVEAMGAGVACVASDVAGASEAIEDGVSGVLVPPGDSAALARALRTLIEDPELRRRMASRGRAEVTRRFALEPTARSQAALYERVIHRAGAERAPVVAQSAQ